MQKIEDIDIVNYNLNTNKYYYYSDVHSEDSIEKLNLKNQIEIYIESDNLNEKHLSKIKDIIKINKDKKYIVTTFVLLEDLYNPISLQKLKKSYKIIKGFKLKFLVKIDDAYLVTYEQYLSAINLLNSIANRINNYRYNNRKLTVFEKFILAFHYTANRVYKLDKFFNNDKRNWVEVITGKNVICSGYTSLLSRLCQQIFKHEELITFHQGSNVFDRKNTLLGGHANNLVLIKDSTYNINGCYHSDSCWCSPKVIADTPMEDKIKFDYALIPLKKLLVSTRYNFQFYDNIFIYRYINANINNRYNYLFKAKEDTIENYILEYFGYKSMRVLVKETPYQKFINLKKVERENLLNNILTRLNNLVAKKHKDLNPQDLLATQVPSVLTLSIFAENQPKLKRFLDNLGKLINGSRFNLELLINTVNSNAIKEIIEEVKDLDIEFQPVTSLKNLINHTLDYYYNNPKSVINLQYEDYIKILQDIEIKKFLKKNKKIIDPKEIPIEKFRTPFTILADFLGIKDKEEK